MSTLAPFQKPTKWQAVIAIDPGEKGSLCLLVPDINYVEFYPTNKEPYEILHWLRDMMDKYLICLLAIEDVHSMYRVSAKANFNFGYNVGLIKGLIQTLQLPILLIQPKSWQKYFRILSKGKEIKKEVYEKIQQSYPHVTFHGKRKGLLDGRSDALAIAHYTVYSTQEYQFHSKGNI